MFLLIFLAQGLEFVLDSLVLLLVGGEGVDGHLMVQQIIQEFVYFLLLLLGFVFELGFLYFLIFVILLDEKHFVILLFQLVLIAEDLLLTVVEFLGELFELLLLGFEVDLVLGNEERLQLNFTIEFD